MTGRHASRGGELDASSVCAFFAHSFSDPTCAKNAPVEAGELVRETSTERKIGTGSVSGGWWPKPLPVPILRVEGYRPGCPLFSSYELQATSYGWEVVD